MRLLLFPLVILFMACDDLAVQNGFAQVKVLGSTAAAFDYLSPDTVFKLPTSLEEISGLSYDHESDALYGVNDEKGRIFVIDKKNGAVRASIKFQNSGDYEGIAVTDHGIFIIESNGELYLSRSDTTIKFKLPFTEKNDVEGLAKYSKDRLLIACKGRALDEAKGKAMYTFNIRKRKVDRDPVLSIKKKDLETFFKQHNGGLKHKKELEERLLKFSPSGIAVHQPSQNIYVLSARGSTLIVCNRRRDIVQVVFLDTKLLPQPEGICFSDDGRLFISTEGVNKKARIASFLESGNK